MISFLMCQSNIGSASFRACVHKYPFFSLFFNQQQHWSLTSEKLPLLEVEYAWLAADVNDNQVGLQQQQQEIDHL